MRNSSFSVGSLIIDVILLQAAGPEESHSALPLPVVSRRPEGINGQQPHKEAAAGTDAAMLSQAFTLYGACLAKKSPLLPTFSFTFQSILGSRSPVFAGVYLSGSTSWHSHSMRAESLSSQLCAPLEPPRALCRSVWAVSIAKHAGGKRAGAC